MERKKKHTRLAVYNTYCRNNRRSHMGCYRNEKCKST